MTGVASSTCFQPTGGEAGGEIRNCLSGFGGARWELPMCSVWRERGRRCSSRNAARNAGARTGQAARKAAQRVSGFGFWGSLQDGAQALRLRDGGRTDRWFVCKWVQVRPSRDTPSAAPHTPSRLQRQEAKDTPGCRHSSGPGRAGDPGSPHTLWSSLSVKVLRRSEG